MVSPRKKYLWRHPSGRIYFRKRGMPLLRIAAEEGTADFDRDYWDIMTGRTWTAKTSFSALIASYRQSDRWTNLKPRTRQDYEKVLLYLEEKIGARDVRTFSRPAAIEAQKANEHRVRFANYIVQILKVLLEHAIDIGWVTDNPAKGVRLLKTPESKKQPHLPWEDWAIAKWRAEAGETERLIFELGLGSVQRPGDWVKFRWSDFDGESLRIVQGKTGKPFFLPCTPELKTALLYAPKRGLTILTQQNGRPLAERRMSQIMRDERKRLGLLAFDLHGLRYCGVMDLAEAGCDDEEIAAYSGHDTKAMLKKYAGEARQRARARTASEKRGR